MKRTTEFFRGFLVSGAIGDALVSPVEFIKFMDITSLYGPGGIQDLKILTAGKAEITDDTQMTLFTNVGFKFRIC